jgi:hypothetical protein
MGLADTLPNHNVIYQGDFQALADNYDRLIVENGKARFPNRHGIHAALFDRFCHGTIMANGRPCEFSIFDQYHRKPAGRRGIAKSTARWKPMASDDAAAFYVVVVP